MKKFFLIAGCLILIGFWAYWLLQRQHVYQEMLKRLEAESRAAQVLVTEVRDDPQTHRRMTTIKFVEDDSQGRPMEPRYFTFSGNLIQFESLVVRFQDKFVAAGDLFRGKSIYLFWKVFRLDGTHTEEYPITRVDRIPGGYKIPGRTSGFENRFWRNFWLYAFDEGKARQSGIKSVQVEAPGIVFIPGYLYTIHIEHNGGLRIDARPVEPIVRGEKVPGGAYENTTSGI
jgi:hypothetical protein